jgi:hypothetical protein
MDRAVAAVQGLNAAILHWRQPSERPTSQARIRKPSDIMPSCRALQRVTATYCPGGARPRGACLAVGLARHPADCAVHPAAQPTFRTPREPFEGYDDVVTLTSGAGAGSGVVARNYRAGAASRGRRCDRRGACANATRLRAGAAPAACWPPEGNAILNRVAVAPAPAGSDAGAQRGGARAGVISSRMQIANMRPWRRCRAIQPSIPAGAAVPADLQHRERAVVQGGARGGC